MPNYYRAFRLNELRRYPLWRQIAEPDLTDLTGLEMVYLDSRHQVILGNPMAPNARKLLGNLTDHWREWCREQVGFQEPDWETESNMNRALLDQLEAQVE